MRRKLLRIVMAIGLFALAVWLNNTSLFSTGGSRHATLLAHRGVHQTYSREGLTAETCTATRIFPPSHDFLENTLPSMEAAFNSGADIVEFDIHPTTDGHFAVLHDWTLDCRTNGTGVTREHSLAELKVLDIGYGYTADGGKTFPLRGKGVGLMPTLDEVLARFPDKRFLINIKSNDPAEGDLLAARLASLPVEQRAKLAVYGGDRPVRRLQARLHGMPVMSQNSLKRCLLRYMALGWTGYVPEDCQKSVIILPINIAPWIWGYPHRLVARMEAAGSQVFVAGGYDGTGFSSGVDDLATLSRLPTGFGGGVWTNRIERIGQAAAMLATGSHPAEGR
jgi:glycerophosphoryl diester phosphodiesterase